jgi:hypothetical protein
MRIPKDSGSSAALTPCDDPATSVRLVFLRFFLNLLAALLDVFANSTHRVAGAERQRSSKGSETIDDLLEHGSSFAEVEILMARATRLHH